jgi:hypothetical protein
MSVGGEGRVEGQPDLARRTQEVLRKLRARLARLARTAEDFRDLAGPAWAAKTGAYVSAAHWAQHCLQEPAGPLLLLDLEGAPQGVFSFVLPRCYFEPFSACSVSCWRQHLLCPLLAARTGSNIPGPASSECCLGARSWEASLAE